MIKAVPIKRSTIGTNSYDCFTRLYCRQPDNRAGARGYTLSTGRLHWLPGEALLRRGGGETGNIRQRSTTERQFGAVGKLPVITSVQRE